MKSNIKIEFVDIKKNNFHSLFKKCATVVCRNLTDNKKFMVCVIVCDNEYIKEINLTHRNQNRATDVLSFPLNEYVVPGVLKEDIVPDMITKRINLGDIILSIDKVIEQAEEYNHSIKREAAFLMVHAMLHLFGYDHIDEEDKLKMQAKEKEIMNILQIQRD